MMAGKDGWTLREELPKSPRKCKALMLILERKAPGSALPRFAEGDELLSATRYWGCRVAATLTAVRKNDGEGKTLSFSRSWRNPEVPSHVAPLILPESGSIVFSPIADEGFDFTQLSRLCDQLDEESAKYRAALENFYYWAAEQFGGCDLNGFLGEIRIERYKLADRFVYRHEGREYGIWGNTDTDEVWEDVPEIRDPDEARSRHAVKLLSFIAPFVAVGAAMWGFSFMRNCSSLPPVTPEIQSGFICVAIAVIAGIFLRGWHSKLITLSAVVFGSYVLIPWLGEAWDMTSELALLSPFSTGDFAEAPVGAVYIASAPILTMLAAAAAPSFAFKVIGGNYERAVCGAVLALAVSPWPMAVASMPEMSSMAIKVGVGLFALLCLFVVGNCGWVLSKMPKRNAGADDVLAKVARIARPSSVFTYVAAAIAVFVLFNQLSISFL